jgi:hypothetical protein
LLEVGTTQRWADTSVPYKVEILYLWITHPSLEADDGQTGSQLLLRALALKTLVFLVKMSASRNRFAELHCPVFSGSGLMEARRFYLSPRFDRLLCEVLVSAGRVAKQPR